MDWVSFYRIHVELVLKYNFVCMCLQPDRPTGTATDRTGHDTTDGPSRTDTHADRSNERITDGTETPSRTQDQRTEINQIKPTNDGGAGVRWWPETNERTNKIDERTV